MHDFHIELIWAKIQIAITALSGWLSYFLGGLDGLLIALLVLSPWTTSPASCALSQATSYPRRWASAVSVARW